jgi:type IV secretory pathway VirD2 relaxase
MENEIKLEFTLEDVKEWSYAAVKYALATGKNSKEEITNFIQLEREDGLKKMQEFEETMDRITSLALSGTISENDYNNMLLDAYLKVNEPLNHENI